MAFTAAELSNITNASLDYYLNKGSTFQQNIEQKPLLKIIEGKAKTFPGGKGEISLGVVGNYGAGGVNDGLAGFTHNDSVNFYTPANIKRVTYPWREHHIGLTLTMTELKIDGLSIVDSSAGMETSAHSQREQHVLAGLLEHKLADFAERYAISLNDLVWGDGTADPKALAGIRSIITADPTTGTVGGLNRATAGNEFWRNRARTAAYAAAVAGDSNLAGHGGNAVTSSASNGGALVQVLQIERRQLMRYGGNPDVFLAGSDFIGAMEVEMRANGYYSMNGFRGTQDASMGGMQFAGVTIQYDPTLDNLGLAKRGYWFDSRDIFLEKMQGEWKRQHDPARPHDQFVVYRSVTSTGQLVATRCNAALVIDIV